jgi:SAM-dependent methyltransferase
MGTNAYLIAKETGMQVLATDLCSPFIEEARKNNDLPNLRYEKLDFHEVDRLKNERFDYIVGNGILHHLYLRLDEALTRMLTLLKQEGKILFFEPNIANPCAYLIFRCGQLRKWARLEPDEMAFSKGFISGKLSRIGYKDVRVEYKDFLLPGIPGWLISPSIVLGNTLERLPLLRATSQSIFISAVK